VTGENAEEFARVNAALHVWRQGDVTLDAGLLLIHLADKNCPLTRAAHETLEQEPIESNPFEVFSPVDGLVVVTQTCDIVKDCAKSEFIDVSPLVPVDDQRLQEIKKGRLIRYAYVPGVADRQLVADLERTMAVEKSVVATWTRVSGWATDDERIAFAAALVRKRQRFAFPSEFNVGLVKFYERLKTKRKKHSIAEGRLIAALDHVRAAPDPNWDATKVVVTFWFLLSREHGITDFDESRRVIEAWMKLITLSGRFVLADPPFWFVEQQDMTVREYLASHPLDYDDLSM
jgi:hypothetical protein